MAQYRTGTVTITDGSNVVIGDETSWLNAVTAGDIFMVKDGKIGYPISSVVSNTELRLVAPFVGSVSAVTYVIASDFTPFFDIPLIAQGDLNTATVVREALIKVEQVLLELDTGQLVVKSRSLTTPPSDPDNDDTYIVPSGATGAWSGNVGQLASYSGSEWRFLSPRNGWRVWVEDQGYADFIYLSASNTWTGGPTGLSAIATADSAHAAADSATAAAAAAATMDAKVSLAQTAANDADTSADAAASAASTATLRRDEVLTLKGQIDTTATAVASEAEEAVAAKAAAELAEDGALAAQEASETARDRAQDWAEKTTGPVVDNAYSAKFHALAAASSSSTAENAADEAVAAKLDAVAKATEAGQKLTETQAVYQQTVSKAGEAAASATAAQTSATNAGTSAATAQSAATDAVNAKVDAVDARTSAQTARAGAETARDLAALWAEKDENLQVQPGQYSAKHWSSKAQYWAQQTAQVVGGTSIAAIGNGTTVQLTAPSQGSTLHFVAGSNMNIKFNQVTMAVTFDAIVPTVEDPVAMSIIFGS